MSDYYLCHHGIKGMKWGVRRYQNKDGSYTAAGKKRRQSYEDRVRQKMKNYDKENPQRSKKDNYTIALRKEGREQGVKTLTKFALSNLIPVVGLPIAVGQIYVGMKRNETLANISDEYNIEGAKRILNQ